MCNIRALCIRFCKVHLVIVIHFQHSKSYVLKYTYICPPERRKNCHLSTLNVLLLSPYEVHTWWLWRTRNNETCLVSYSVDEMYRAHVSSPSSFVVENKRQSKAHQSQRAQRQSLQFRRKVSYSSSLEREYVLFGASTGVFWKFGCAQSIMCQVIQSK